VTRCWPYSTLSFRLNCIHTPARMATVQCFFTELMANVWWSNISASVHRLLNQNIIHIIYIHIIHAVKHFRHYLHGRKFVIHTDCNSLRASRTKADLTPRVHRWWAFLQAFDFSVEYRKGNQMAHVDCLSRNPIPEASKMINRVVEARVVLAVITDNWLIAEQQRDLGIVEIMN